MDTTALLAAIDMTDVLAALAAVAAIKVAPNVTRWGFNKLIGWFN
jgi:hypothetical protein